MLALLCISTKPVPMRHLRKCGWILVNFMWMKSEEKAQIPLQTTLITLTFITFSYGFYHSLFFYCVVINLHTCCFVISKSKAHNVPDSEPVVAYINFEFLCCIFFSMIFTFIASQNDPQFHWFSYSALDLRMARAQWVACQEKPGSLFAIIHSLASD